MDDLTQIRQIFDGVDQGLFKLLKPRDTHRLPSPFHSSKAKPGKNYQLSLGAAVTYTETKSPTGSTVRKFLDAGQNPPDGAIVTYYLREELEDEITLDFLDSSGVLIKSFSSETQSDGDSNELRISKTEGMNRFVWNLRYPDGHRVPGDKTTEDKVTGPLATPGTYQVRLNVAGETQTQSFEIIKDPRVAATQGDFELQFELAIQVRDKLSETHDSINRIRSVRQQVEEWVSRAQGHSAEEVVKTAATAVNDKLSSIEDQLIQVKYRGARDRLNLPTKLNTKLAEILEVIQAADFAPTSQTYLVFEDVSSRVDPHLHQIQRIFDDEVAEFENLVHELGIPAIVPRAEA